MNLGVAFSPLVPEYVVWAAFAVAVLISALLVLARSRGALVRAIALALMVLALANPSFTREDREPLPSVAAVVVDKSPSQDFGDRNAQTQAALQDADRAAQAHPGPRGARRRGRRGRRRDRRHQAVLRARAALADVPPDRVAGAIMITDGRVHDVPADAARARLCRAGARADHRPRRTSATAASC